MQTPRLGALRAGVGREAALVMEGKDFDTGFGGIEDALCLLGTGHLALEAAGALLGLELQRFEHGYISCTTLNRNRAGSIDKPDGASVAPTF